MSWQLGLSRASMAKHCLVDLRRDGRVGRLVNWQLQLSRRKRGPPKQQDEGTSWRVRLSPRKRGLPQHCHMAAALGLVRLASEAGSCCRSLGDALHSWHSLQPVTQPVSDAAAAAYAYLAQRGSRHRSLRDGGKHLSKRAAQRRLDEGKRLQGWVNTGGRQRFEQGWKSDDRNASSMDGRHIVLRHCPLPNQ